MRCVKHTRRIRRKKIQRSRRQRGGRSNSREPPIINDLMFQTSYDNALREYTASIRDSGNAHSLQEKEYEFGIYLTNYAYILANWVNEHGPGACLTNDENSYMDMSYYQTKLLRCININIPRDSQIRIRFYIFGKDTSIFSSVFRFEENGDICRLPGSFQRSTIRLDSRFVDRDGVPYPPRSAP